MAGDCSKTPVLELRNALSEPGTDPESLEHDSNIDTMATQKNLRSDLLKFM
jgi:hypothetical protein